MLYIVPTPIGNLEDITLRALRILQEVDLIAAEDTRKTLSLLNHFEIKKPLISYYEHNKRSRGEVLLRHLREGQNIALVSDAGCPGICDPGADLIKEALAQNIEICVLPGPCAAITALVASGLDTDRFAFEGFLPREKKTLKKHLQSLANEERTMIFYEAPHRLLSTLQVIYEVLGERQIVLCRELSKKFEEIIRGKISEIIEKYEHEEIRGEFVVLMEGKTVIREEFSDILSLLPQMAQMMKDGNSRRQAAKILAERYGVSAKTIYDASLDEQKK